MVEGKDRRIYLLQGPPEKSKSSISYFLDQLKTALPSLFFFWQLQRFACVADGSLFCAWTSIAASLLPAAHVICNY